MGVVANTLEYSEEKKLSVKENRQRKTCSPIKMDGKKTDGKFCQLRSTKVLKHFGPR